MQKVVLQKLGGSKQVVGRLTRLPEKGKPVVVEFDDGINEYVTSAVTRMLQLVDKGTIYFETLNSKYRLSAHQPSNKQADRVAVPRS